MSGIGKIRYIKISRTDGNGNDITNALESLESIVMPLSTGNKMFNILNRSRENEYFLFYVSMAGTENIPGVDKSSPEYTFTGSIPSGEYVADNKNSQILPISLVSQNSDFGFYDSATQRYQFKTYAQKQIKISSTIYHHVSPIGQTVKIGIAERTPGNNLITYLSAIFRPGASFGYTSSFTTTIDPIAGNEYFIAIQGSSTTFVTASISSVQTSSFFISSSNAVANPKDMSIEPYFTSPFYGTDCDVLQGEVERIRSNPFLQDVDYSTSTIVPVNVEALASGSATRATVPESYYTALSQINNRYNGTKNQTEKINEWTKSDNNIGTYGKTPPVESLKALVAYSDWIGGNSPEKHNSCAAHIQYIINEDGTINEPNLLNTSISNIQYAYETNQNLTINLTDPPVGQGMEILNGLKNIDRGGYRIEPILYTQSGSLYTNGTVNWTGSALVGSTLGSGSVDDYMTNAIMDSDQTTTTTDTIIDFDVQTITPGSPSANPYDVGNAKYTITQNMINDGVDLYFEVQANVYNALNVDNQIYIEIFNQTTSTTVGSSFYSLIGNITSLANQPVFLWSTAYQNKPLITSAYITSANLEAGHEYVARIHSSTPGATLEGNDGPTGGLYPAFFSVKQFPAPDGGDFTVGTNTIWGYPSSTDFSVITASQDSINNSYGIYSQVNIPNSGFKKISEKWSLKPGDEFRFEDREDRVFQVVSVTAPNVHPSGTLEVQLDSQIPTSSINLDHFVIRRYVEDGSFILFDETKPSGNTGPSLIKPQFVTKTLTKEVDEYILDLTNKGLIT